MAAVCEVCGKGPSWGMNVSHSHRRTKRRWNPNIQRVPALVGGTPEAALRLHRVASRAARSSRPAEAASRRRASSRATTRRRATAVVVRDTDLAEFDLAADALDGSIFRMLRQGQRVVFDLDDDGRATRLRLGSEVDMETPGA